MIQASEIQRSECVVPNACAGAHIGSISKGTTTMGMRQYRICDDFPENDVIHHKYMLNFLSDPCHALPGGMF